MTKERVTLITGIAGGLARLTGAELVKRGHRIIGVDYRPLPRPLDYDAEVFQANYNKTRIEDVFRRHRPQLLLHLGRVGNLKERMGKRFDLNVIGSGKIMELALKYEVNRMVVLSTFHIYGAHPHNHTPIYEDEPLRAGPAFPQIADAIQLDNMASQWVWRHPDVQTVVLRPCNVVGPSIHNAISRFLRQPFVPVMLGFDPMTQFIHERDMVSAIVAAGLGEAVGVFNVAGRSAIPLREAFNLTKAKQIPMPTTVAFAYLAAMRLVSNNLPPYLVNFFKYPCVIADDRFREAFDWQPWVGEVESIRSTVGW
jgi:UDP-glucose 4-epimerase